ncbi:MAG: cation:proton antiporter domain-containing protein [Promethearchaeota archaeon]
MENFIILLAILYSIGISLGFSLQKYLKIPWMFTFVLSGLVFANIGMFKWINADPAFISLSKMGQLGMMFIIGLSIDFKEFRNLAKQIFVGNFITCFVEGFGLSLLFFFAIPVQFSNSYLICLLAGIGYTTIGEVLFAAVLTELKIEKSRFGQLSIGMGVVDDFIEITILTLEVKHDNIASRENIEKYGLLRSPAIVAEGNVLIQGKVPNLDEIERKISDLVELLS